MFVPENGVDPTRTSIIKVIGVGGGGNNAINHMFRQGIEHVSFVVCNTDKQALNNSPVPCKVLLGHTGLGAGNKPEIAKAAAEESIDELEKLFDDNTKMVFITAGMGGGTGTGAGPVVAKVAKERGVLTIGIVTIPFLFEGEKKILKALEGADEMNKYVDALLVINNDQLTQIYPDLDFINAFGKADDTLSTAARSISEIITCDGHINLDFNDVDTTLRNGGAAIISTGYGEGEHRVTAAIQEALRSPLLKDCDITGSKKLLFNLYFSREAEHKFVMSEVNELNKFITSIDPEVDVIWGVGYDESLGEKVKMTILAARIRDRQGHQTPLLGGTHRRHIGDGPGIEKHHAHGGGVRLRTGAPAPQGPSARQLCGAPPRTDGRRRRDGPARPHSGIQPRQARGRGDQGTVDQSPRTSGARRHPPAQRPHGHRLFSRGLNTAPPATLKNRGKPAI